MRLLTAALDGHDRWITPRYVIRPSPEGFTITDIWTGQVATLATRLQTRLSRKAAEHTAESLNHAVARDPAPSQGAP